MPIPLKVAPNGRIAYLRLLRASNQLFKGDDFALKEFRSQVRSQFESSRGESDPSRIQTMLNDALDAEDMLVNHFVQGKMNERGNFEIGVPSTAGLKAGDDGAPPVFEPKPINLEEVEKMGSEDSLSAEQLEKDFITSSKKKY